VRKTRKRKRRSIASCAKGDDMSGEGEDNSTTTTSTSASKEDDLSPILDAVVNNGIFYH
jgi:hypothetical protein